jgi:hypothetical protein
MRPLVPEANLLSKWIRSQLKVKREALPSNHSLHTPMVSAGVCDDQCIPRTGDDRLIPDLSFFVKANATRRIGTLVTLSL